MTSITNISPELKHVWHPIGKIDSFSESPTRIELVGDPYVVVRLDGQVKVLAMAGDTGDMVVTVTNAGWKASGTGTITFNDIGDAVTLMYINSKWYCIGNNGAVFA